MDLDAHRTPILHPYLVMGRRSRTARLLNRGRDADEQFRTDDAPQIEAGGAAGGLEIRAGVAAKLQNGQRVVDDDARRREARQQQSIRFAQQRLGINVERLSFFSDVSVTRDRE
jgi:hypothetical protein